MLSLTSKSPQKTTPHLLPAQIHHNGSLPQTRQYFTPTTSDNTQHAYFRGRHLHGKTVALPSNYTGAVLHVTDKDLPTTSTETERQGEEDEDGEADEKVETKVAEKIGAFDEFVVWRHGDGVDGKADAYVRGVEEWIGFAEAMHCEGDEEESVAKDK